MSAGSRRTRVVGAALALPQLERGRVVERRQPALADERLVDAAEPAAEGRVDGGTERDGLAVHRPAGRDDEVGERDQALRVDGVLGDDHRREPQPLHVGALLVGARDHDRVHLLVAAEALERAREHRVAVAVVERDVGRRPQDDEDPRLVDAEVAERGGVGLEVGEVVLLLQSRVAAELVAGRPVPGEPLGRDRLGHDHPPRGAAAELVLEPGPLVVERRAARDPEAARRQRQLVRAVRERDVEAAALRPAAQAAQP